MVVVVVVVVVVVIVVVVVVASGSSSCSSISSSGGSSSSDCSVISGDCRPIKVIKDSNLSNFTKNVPFPSKTSKSSSIIVARSLDSLRNQY